MAQEIQTRIDKWECVKWKIFCTGKERIARIKRHPKEWEKIFASYLSDTGAINRIFKELKKHIPKEWISQLTVKWIE
jgi:hypothetical protein